MLALVITDAGTKSKIVLVKSFQIHIGTYNLKLNSCMATQHIQELTFCCSDPDCTDFTPIRVKMSLASLGTVPSKISNCTLKTISFFL